MDSADIIHIFTDGSSKGNPGPGGYAAILKFNNKIKKISKGFRLTTNNRMELMAIIDALKMLRIKNIPIKAYTDSKYIVNAINNKWIFNWKRQNWNKANPDLWQEFFTLYSQLKKIEFCWIKGHNGDIYNEECDKLAVAAAKSQNLHIDEYYEKLIKR